MVHIYVPSRSRLAPDPKIHSAAESTQMTYFAHRHRAQVLSIMPGTKCAIRPPDQGRQEGEGEGERETRRIDTRLYDIHRARWEETIGCDQITPWILEAERPRICCKNSPWTTYRGWQNTHSARNQEKRDGERGRERESPTAHRTSIETSLPLSFPHTHPPQCLPPK